MKRVIFFLFLLTLFSSLSAQEHFQISKPEVTFANNIITIKYDITGCGINEYINVRLIALNSKGDTLRPVYISGDIGKRVNCGFGKKIEWNIVRDSIKIDDDIEVFIQGKEIVIPLSTIDNFTQNHASRGKVIGLSAIVPGLGQKVASGKSGYLALSGLVYGAAGASAYYYIKHNNYYNDYLALTGTAADEAYIKSENSFKMSQYFLYGAAGAWAVNLVWSAVIPIKEKPFKNTSLNIVPTPRRELLLSASWTF
ncbi:MAG: hypothetical protein NT092_10835 [Bacteroidia bacterium]|nr:hypothetical protein [Bacteroidia bacterium]